MVTARLVILARDKDDGDCHNNGGDDTWLETVGVVMCIVVMDDAEGDDKCW